MTKPNKFNLGKDILNQSTATFKQTEKKKEEIEVKEEKKSVSDKRVTKPTKAIEEQKRHKVGIYFTDSEFDIINEALMKYAQETKKLPKMASFLHELILKKIKN